jgi:hypothetical protein
VPLLNCITPFLILRINDEHYLLLYTGVPLYQFHKFIIDRLRRNAHQRKKDAGQKNIVVNLQPTNDVSAFTNAIEEQFNNKGLGITIYDEQTHLKTIGPSSIVWKKMRGSTLKCDAEHLNGPKKVLPIAIV